MVFFLNQIQNLFFGILYHLFSCKIGICLSCSSIEQTKEIVNFSRSTNCRPRIFISSFLFNGNNRTQSRNFINIRTFHIPQEITGIRRKRFYISSLSFSKNSIKRQRGFATPTKSCNNRKTITRYFYINIFKIMYTCTVYFYFILVINHLFSQNFPQKINPLSSFYDILLFYEYYSINPPYEVSTVYILFLFY